MEWIHALAICLTWLYSQSCNLIETVIHPFARHDCASDSTNSFREKTQIQNLLKSRTWKCNRRAFPLRGWKRCHIYSDEVYTRLATFAVLAEHGPIGNEFGRLFLALLVKISLTFFNCKQYWYGSAWLFIFGWNLPSSVVPLPDFNVLEWKSRFLLENTDSNSIESVPSAEAISVPNDCYCCCYCFLSIIIIRFFFFNFRLREILCCRYFR